MRWWRQAHQRFCVNADTDHHLEHPPSYAEWEKAACGELTAKQYNRMIDLRVKTNEGQLSANDTLLLKFLEEKETAVSACDLSLRFSHVEHLAPP
jgi:hypothetical protein